MKATELFPGINRYELAGSVMIKVPTIYKNAYREEQDRFVHSRTVKSYAAITRRKLQFLMVIGMLYCSSIQAQDNIPAEDCVRYTKYNLYGELGGSGFLSAPLGFYCLQGNPGPAIRHFEDRLISLTKDILLHRVVALPLAASCHRLV